MNFYNPYLKKKKLISVLQVFIFVSITTIFFIPGTFSTVSTGTPNSSIIKIYGPSTNISGWMNTSFEDESVNSAITTSFDGNNTKTLILNELLEKNPHYNYSCNPLDCEENYEPSSGQTSKSYFLVAQEGPKTFGFKLEGQIQSIDSIEFDLISNEGASCQSQVKMDLLNDKTTDLINTRVHATGSCQPKNQGCFNSSKTTIEFDLSPGKTYCQKINLTQHPGFKMGAWIKKTSGSSTAIMSLHDLNGIQKESCSITNIENQSGEEYSCNINYMVSEPKEHLLCIYLSGGNGNYRIKGYHEATNACGYPGTPGSTQETAAYSLFAQGRQFDSIGTLKITNNLTGAEKISDKIWNYLIRKQGLTEGKIDCSSGCAVPISLITGINYHQISLNNLEIKYNTNAGQITDNKFYDLTASPTKITSSPGKLFLDKLGIETPSTPGNKTFSLNINGQTIISEEIEIKNVPIIRSISPTTTAAAFPTEFTIEVSTPENISIARYIWEFGDNETEITSENKTTHSYLTNKSYNLKITLTDTRGLNSSRTFNINVTSPRELINSTLGKFTTNLRNIKEDINSQSPTNQKSLNSILRIENITSEIENLKRAYVNAETDEEYKDIVNKMIMITMPEEIFLTTKADSVELFPGKNQINLDIIKKIGGGDYNQERSQDYENAIISWQQENAEIKINFKEFSAEYNSKIEPLVKTFEIQIVEKRDISHDYYLIVPKANIKFNEPVQEEGDFAYINLRETPRLSLYTTENIDFTNINAFIAPPINRLSIGDLPAPGERGKISRELILVLSIIFLIIATMTTYLLLQQWYRKKYEKYLFPNRNDLYNIIHYVNNAKKKDHTDKEITQSLKKAGWSSEQIKYAIKKYEGKKTGMFELPLPRIFGKGKETK
ncbi:MAG: PKD domain-containing protein [Nanoarchaeota archaeon]|nr:PKD domain-containing protein [Nanoarchaeota archaeon]